ncbi:MAG TPA: hypothetical protein DCQ26_02265 [Marinilabiliales bacterium]|nr:hypothetical protein [Marinilabiliales bacterium]HAZ00820.1 hypothetical protein [Marinilabiliales bacterium]HBO76239.1 hypothetical protein [Marinilabiliales bacterium]HBY53379.1 hypothetical protein [Marinilabiliales bacterium]
MRTPAVQTMIAKKLASQLSAKFHTVISIERARYGLKRNLVLQNLLVKDLENDSLIYIERLDLTVSKLELLHKKLELAQLDVKNLKSKLKTLTDSTYNFSFILDQLNSQSGDPLEWTISLSDLNMVNNSIQYQWGTERFHFNDISAHCTDFVYDSTQLSFNLNSFSFGLNQQINVQNISFNFNLDQQKVAFDEIHLLSNHSYVNVDKFYIKNGSNRQLPVLHFEKVQSKIFLNEFSSIIPRFSQTADYFSITGNLIANLKSIKGEQVVLRLGNESELQSSFVVHNYNTLDSIDFALNIQELHSNVTDIKHIACHYFKQDTNQLTNFLDPLGKLNFQGTIKGNNNEIDAAGRFASAIGVIHSDVHLERKTDNQKISIDGNLRAIPIYPSVLIQNKSIGELAFNLNTHGFYSSKEGIQMGIDGMIQKFVLNGRSIDSVGVKGNIEKEMFTGRISSFDPKIRFDFEGVLNFDTLPSYDFTLNMYYANLYQLGFNKKDSLANLSFDVKAKFLGNKFENSSGGIVVTNLYYFKDTTYFATDSISVSSVPTAKGNRFNFNSEYFTIELEGHFNTLTVSREIETLIKHHLPSLGKSDPKKMTNDFTFTIVAEYPHPLTGLLLPEFRISPGTIVTGRFDGASNNLNFSVFSNRVEFFNRRIDELNLKAYTKNNRLFVNMDSKEFRYAENTSLKNFMSSMNIFNDSIKLNFNWNNWLDKNYSGNLNSLVTFSKNLQNFNLKLDIYPSNIVVHDTIWYLSKASLIKDSSGFSVANLKIDNGSSDVSVEGRVSKNPNDSLSISLKNINLTYLNPIIKDDQLLLGGIITGKTVIKDAMAFIQINSNFDVQNLSLNHELIGNTHLESSWDQTNKKLDMYFDARINDLSTIEATGFYLAPEDFLDINVNLNRQSVKILQPFLEPTFIHLKGELAGKIKLYGTYPDLKWKGSVFTDNTSFTIASTGVNYQLRDSVQLNNFQILFNNAHVFDKDQNEATVNGNITHHQFGDFSIDLKMNTQRIMGINTRAVDNPLFYGTVYGSGYVKIYGPTDAINIDVSATTLNNSIFNIPLEGKSDIEENSFIEFYDPLEVKKSESEKQKQLVEDDYETNLIMDLTVTPDVEVQIIFDPRIGDALKAHGFARLNMESLKNGFSMYGDYQISKGEFTFALQNVIHKKFEILAGSNVIWSGDPIDAQINLDAIYKIRRASVYDLTFDDADKEKKVEVDCHLLMTDKLVNPTIKFAVQVPATTNEAAIDQINTLPEEEINKQVLSLLLVNKFMPLYQQSYAPNTSGGLGATTVSELLSKQLSKWISQINTDFDLGFVYRPGTETTEQEYEVALSTNLWNDRITVNSNLGYTVQNQLTTAKSPYTTDVQVELKVNQNGNIRLRAFQKVNNDIEFSQAPYTQGIGIFYTEEFDDFNDLMIKMFRKEYAFKPEEPEVKKEE